MHRRQTPWTLRHLIRAVGSRRWRVRKLARLKWRLGMLPNVFVRISPNFGAQLIVSGIGYGSVSWKAMYERDPCVYCYRPMTTWDHIEPLSRGGKFNGWENIAPACRACNAAKGAKPLIAFLADINHPAVPKRMMRRAAKNTKRALVRHLMKPEQCARPLRFPLADKILAALAKM